MFLKQIRRFCQENNKNVFFELKIGVEPKVHRVEFKLYDEVVPKTAKNFRSLCIGHEKLSYKNSILHRIIPQFMLQGGDITHHNGMGGTSIYGRNFQDENFKIRHDKVGLLSMANAGPNTNGSQFFITTVTCPWLDGKHVVFGEVIKGYDIVKKVESIGTQTGKPLQKVTIVNCGQVDEQ